MPHFCKKKFKYFLQRVKGTMPEKEKKPEKPNASVSVKREFYELAVEMALILDDSPKAVVEMCIKLVWDLMHKEEHLRSIPEMIVKLDAVRKFRANPKQFAELGVTFPQDPSTAMAVGVFVKKLRGEQKQTTQPRQLKSSSSGQTSPPADPLKSPS